MSTLSSICYHYLAREDEFKRIWGHSFELFSQHIDFLKSEYEAIRPEDLLAKKFQFGKKYILFTFDDGLKEHIRMAGHLDKLGLKGVFAVPSCVLRGEPANPQIIHFGAAYFGVRKFYEFVKEEVKDGPTGEMPLMDVLQHIKHLFKFDLPFEIGRRALLNIYEKHLLPTFPDFMDRVHLNRSEIARLAGSGHAIAVHSDTHPVIGKIGGKPALMEKEVLQAKKDLSAASGQDVKIFAYPFGAAGEILPSAEYFTKNGYELVLTTYKKQDSLDFSDLGRYCTMSQDSTADLRRELWNYKINE